VEQKVDANISPFMRSGAMVHPLFDQAAALWVKAEHYRFRPGSQGALDALCRPML